MKKLIIPKLSQEVDRNNLELLADYLQQQPAQQINVINWRNFPYCPEISFRIMYDDEAFFLRYDVNEKYIRARADKNNGSVWLDSCLEFFLSPEGNDVYYNLEMNCIGTKLLALGKPDAGLEHANDEILSRIVCRSSLGNVPFEEKKGDFNWNLVVIIPFSSYWEHNIKPVSGLKMKGNFYKCGDELSESHFVSWNEIKTETPSFHQPRFFGELVLG